MVCSIRRRRLDPAGRLFDDDRDFFPGVLWRLVCCEQTGFGTSTRERTKTARKCVLLPFRVNHGGTSHSKPLIRSESKPDTSFALPNDTLHGRLIAYRPIEATQLLADLARFCRHAGSHVVDIPADMATSTGVCN
jgi:hypothetical protein